MLFGKQDSAGGVNCETTQAPADGAGKSQAAGGIEKKKQAFPDLVVLTPGPQARPLHDGQGFSISNPADGAFDVEGDGYGFNRRAFR